MALCLGISCAPLLVAANYYVDFEGGNDAAGGSSTAGAWKHCPGDTNATGNAATAILQPGDTVFFKGGVFYRGSVKVNQSGAQSAPITFDGNTQGTWGSGRAILDGSERVSDWYQCVSSTDCYGNPAWANIYYTLVSSNTDIFTANLREDDQLLSVAQEPNQPDPFWIDDINYYYTVPCANVTLNSIVDPIHLNQSTSTYWDGAYVGVWVTPNRVTYRSINSFIPAENKITYANTEPPYTDRDELYTLFNSINVLDKSGEFCLAPYNEPDGRRRLYLWPLTLGDMNQKTITMSRLLYGFNIAEKSYLRFQGFTIQKYTGTGTRDGIGIGMYTGATTWTSGIEVRNNLIRWNCHGLNTGYGGIYISYSSGCVIENNTIEENILQCGIFCTNIRNGLVRNNYCRKAGATTLRFYNTHYTSILGNSVVDSRGVHANGITLYLNCSHDLIADNLVLNSGTPLTFEDSSDLTFYNNILVGDGTNNVNEWSASTGTVVFCNNVMVNNDNNYAFSLQGDNSPGVQYHVYNNIMDGGDFGTSIDRGYNIYTGLSWRQTPGYGWALENGEFVQTDLNTIFVDPANDDYRLKAGSPAVNAGADIRAFLPVSTFPSYDFNRDRAGTVRPQGGAWDIGVFESPGAGATPLPPRNFRQQ